MKHSLSRLKKILNNSLKNGVYIDGSLFELEPETSIKLLSDREYLLETLKIIRARFPYDKFIQEFSSRAIEDAEAGWPKDMP